MPVEANALDPDRCCFMPSWLLAVYFRHSAVSLLQRVSKGEAAVMIEERIVTER